LSRVSVLTLFLESKTVLQMSFGVIIYKETPFT